MLSRPVSYLRRSVLFHLFLTAGMTKRHRVLDSTRKDSASQPRPPTFPRQAARALCESIHAAIDVVCVNLTLTDCTNLTAGAKRGAGLTSVVCSARKHFGKHCGHGRSTLMMLKCCVDFSACAWWRVHVPRQALAFTYARVPNSMSLTAPLVPQALMGLNCKGRT